MARPRRKPANADRKRINLSFNLGVQSEAAAYEILKKLSMSRKSTEYVTALIINHLADETRAKESQEVPVATPVVAPVISPKIGEPIAAVRSFPTTEAYEIPPVKTVSAPLSIESGAQSEGPSQKQEQEVSQEGLAAAMAIFGF